MNFGFSQEQALLREQVRKFLDEQCPSDEVRRIIQAEPGYNVDQWQQMADLGWLGLVADPDFGGVGLSWVDLIVVLEEMGRSLFPSPYISHCLAVDTLSRLGTESQKKNWLSQMASGQCIAVPAILDVPDDPITDNVLLTALTTDGGLSLTGSKPFVCDAGAAQLFLVAYRTGDGLGLALVDREQSGVNVSPSATLDLTKRTGTVELNEVRVSNDNTMAISDRELVAILDRGVVAVTAEMVGAAESIIDMTTDYAKDRIQFGNPIGKYQGVKHRLAEMYVDVESFKSLVYFAAWTVDENPSELPRAASLAKAYASDAFAQMGINGVQLHGAIGFTAEYDIQLYLKRSKWARPMFGDADYHYERVAAMSL